MNRGMDRSRMPVLRWHHALLHRIRRARAAADGRGDPSDAGGVRAAGQGGGHQSAAAAADPADRFGAALYGGERRPVLRREDLFGARAAWGALPVSAVPFRRRAAAGADGGQLSGANPHRGGKDRKSTRLNSSHMSISY